MSYVGSDSGINTAGSVTLNYPAGTATGDIALLFLASVDVSEATMPAGYAPAGNGLNGNLEYDCWTKTLNVSDAGDPVTITDGSANKVTALLIVMRDWIGLGTESTAPLSVNASSTTRALQPATLTATREVVSAVLSRGNTTLSTWTAPAGITRVEQAFNTTTGETSGAVGYGSFAAGTVSGDWVSNVADLRGTTFLFVQDVVPAGIPAPPSGVLYAGIEHTIWTISGPLALAQAGALA